MNNFNLVSVHLRQKNKTKQNLPSNQPPPKMKRERTNAPDKLDGSYIQNKRGTWAAPRRWLGSEDRREQRGFPFTAPSFETGIVNQLLQRIERETETVERLGIFFSPLCVVQFLI